MFFPQLRRGVCQQLLLAVLTGVLEKDILVVFGDPLLDDDVVGITL